MITIVHYILYVAMIPIQLNIANATKKIANDSYLV
jgi:hypothetical protein